MKTRFCLFLSVLFFLCSWQKALSQDLYNTVNGQLGFVGVHQDTSFTAVSNKLVATLDYNTGMIKFRVDLSTITSKSDTLQSLFRSIQPNQVTFNGNIGQGSLNTKEHGRRGLSIGGKFSLNGVTKYKELNAFLICYPAAEGDVACQLSMDFTINLDEYNLTDNFSNFYENINIQISQAILERQ